MSSALRIPKPYINWAKAMIESFWTKPLDKGQRPLLSKTQIRTQIVAGIERFQAEDGSPSTWTDCPHCEGEGIYFSYGSVTEQIGVVGQPDQAWNEKGLCFQCNGKGKQSAADRKRNWGYQKRQAERENY